MKDHILQRQLQAFAPRSILSVGDSAGTLVADYARQNPGCELTRVGSPEGVASLLEAPSVRRYDFGITAGYLEYVDKDAGSVLIARLRDVLVRRLCVVVAEAGPEQKTTWTDTDMTALGLAYLDRVQNAKGVFRIYGFDIASYKRTPDWLNPRHWAHPERWNKDRW